MQQKIDRLTDILRRDDGISGAMSYTEQISWILFLKYLNDYEEEKASEALINGTSYSYILDEEHRWNKWACPKDENGKTNLKLVKSGEDLTKYVNEELFPYLKEFKSMTIDPESVKYKIGEIFEFLNNKIANGHTLREALDIIDELNFQSKDDLFELSLVYEKLLQMMGRDAGNAGEFYTPRALIKAIAKAINPKVGKTVYDPAAGSCGFLIQAYELMKEQKNLSSEDWNFLHNNTFYGIEKTPLGFVMGVMNMILHGIESPNIQKRNTLTIDIRQIQEKDRYDYILANPPFGGKEHAQVQQNFPVQSNATELLFMQHFMKNLKLGGKAGIVVPEGILFNTNNAFQEVKKQLLENFNLHTIVSLPAGVFLPYSGVKTNVIFFDRTGSTQDIWFYEVNPSYKLTKNKPIIDEHFEDFLNLFEERKESENSWIVKANDILDYDLSAKNPNNKTEIDHLPPSKILIQIRNNEESVSKLLDEIEEILNQQD
ncbi:MAG: N-6 DNA methylase [Candidatus Cloacimonetes bacterium]|nr:N-6 DNA methylase [Candidatus Cloacimonadota bacterium]